MRQAQKQTDRLGRATFHHIPPQEGVRPTLRELRWLKHIERHGPQNSAYLFELTRDTHRCRDTALRQMQKLRAGGVLRLPHQQRATEFAEFNPYIYDLTKKAQDHLFDLGISEPTIRPTGHWGHGYMTSCVTSSIDIAAAREGVRYIPAHDILAIKDASLAIPIGGQKLIPDQLFALDYGSSYRVFALEVDRGTEPKTSTVARKSYASSIEMYRLLIERQIYKSHYGLKASLLVLWVFTNRTNEARFLEMMRAQGGGAKAFVLTQVIQGTQEPRMPSKVWTNLYHEPWTRVSYGEVLLTND
ncbi:replication-relaxation family protein [Pseudohalocynthiibacter sp. F2068]|uniref:replication-relaxation family protein n=1 Tax=Pseudohalocynthiibacter sp. F2068 TaxID=2926418 RepID=UPI001FF16D3F|nr:replication-relaxation family protein [Pseudohalocynthiibacter sp. F2068]MCK0103218.1 replication-relaxation family protein [Pseudohalocynthiibacter sp. F2068]